MFKLFILLSGRSGCCGRDCCLVLAVIACISACSPGSGDLPALSDTGITWGGDYPKGNHDTCKAKVLDSAAAVSEAQGDILRYQDCSQAKGVAFKYLVFDSRGQALGSSAAVKGGECVLDEISGLMWEVKMPADGIPGNQGLHDGDDLFTWYNSNTKQNGGAIGDWNSKLAQCTGYVKGQPTTYCNTEEYLNRINRQGLCGFSDWRLPSRIELESLVHYGRTEPAINTQFFPGTANQFYWSASPVVQQVLMAWAVNFQFGYSAAVQRNNARAVRLVRSWSKEQ